LARIAFNVSTRGERRVRVVGDDAAKCGSRGLVFVVCQAKARHPPDMGPRGYIVTALRRDALTPYRG